MSESDEEILDVDELLGRKKFGVTDGSSVYIFHTDKSFVLAPVGKCGRTIGGTWDNTSGLVVRGLWSLINGVVDNEEDYREMDLWIGWISAEPDRKQQVMFHGDIDIHTGYLSIERLEKIEMESEPSV